MNILNNIKDFRILKFLMLVGFIIGSSSSLIASNIQKYQKTDQSKVRLYFVHKIGCPACAQTMDNMKRSDIAKILSENFKIIKIESRHKDRLPKLWMHTHTYPTLNFADSHDNKLINSIHNVPPRKLKATLMKAIKANAHK